MVDTYNKPVLTPPQGEVPKKTNNPLVIFLIVVSLLALLVLSAIVIWLLPSKTPVVLDNTLPIQTTSNNTMDTGKPPANVDTSEAEQALEEWLRSQATAEAENIQAWGGEEYASILNSAAQGDQFFQSDDFDSAKIIYRDATDNITLLLLSKDDKLQAFLIQGEEFLVKEDSNNALSTFQQALLIDPENEKALYGFHRANNLDHVLALYNEGLQREVENNLDQAQHLLREARQIDSDFTPASAALERVNKKQQDVSFRDAMSRALTALSNGQLSATDKDLDEAAQLRPQDPAMLAARQRVKEMHKIQKLKDLQNKADNNIRAEDWEDVIKIYNKAIQIDNKVGFATIGLPEAKKRFQLDRSLKSSIANPERLQDEGPLREARQILKNAQRIENPGEILQSQIRTLSAQIQNAMTTVNVVFHSDNETEIEIYHIGRFRPFLQKPITLKPGTYTVVGRKPGFKDVRLAIKITAEMKMPVFVIRCEEPI